MTHTGMRSLWVLLPLLAVAIMAAPEWPARAAMMDSPWRETWVPAATTWALVRGGAADAPELQDTSPTVAPPAPAVATTASVAPSTAQEPTQAALAAVNPTPAPASTTAIGATNGAVAAPQGGTALMLGDSLMGEVAAGLRQYLPRSFTVVDRHKSSTGLTNVAYYDWPGTAEAAAKETQPTWVIIHMGANDAQDMMLQGHFARLGSPAWVQEYEARAQTMIARIRAVAPKATIVWIGLPAMRAPAFEAKMVVIRAAQAAAAKAQGVAYLDGHEALGADYSKDGVVLGGSRRILRADDGIHYSRIAGAALAHEAAVLPALSLPWGSTSKN